MDSASHVTNPQARYRENRIFGLIWIKCMYKGLFIIAAYANDHAFHFVF
jgi:hypothetical protein